MTSICKICAANSKPGVTIIWDENIKSQKTGKLIPLESDRFYHRHYDPTMIANESTPAAAKTITSTDPDAGAKWIRSIMSGNKQEDVALEALTNEFRTLLDHISQYLKQQADK